MRACIYGLCHWYHSCYSSILNAIHIKMAIPSSPCVCVCVPESVNPFIHSYKKSKIAFLIVILYYSYVWWWWSIALPMRFKIDDHWHWNRRRAMCMDFDWLRIDWLVALQRAKWMRAPVDRAPGSKATMAVKTDRQLQPVILPKLVRPLEVRVIFYRRWHGCWVQPSIQWHWNLTRTKLQTKMRSKTWSLLLLILIVLVFKRIIHYYYYYMRDCETYHWYHRQRNRPINIYIIYLWNIIDQNNMKLVILMENLHFCS